MFLHLGENVVVPKKDIIGRVVLIVSTAQLLKVLIVGVFIVLVLVIIYFDSTIVTVPSNTPNTESA